MYTDIGIKGVNDVDCGIIGDMGLMMWYNIVTGLMMCYD